MRMRCVHLDMSPAAVLCAATFALAMAGPAWAQPARNANAQPVTFSKDIAPILQAHCQECHRPGSIAPMSLLTYEDVRPWARSIKLRVEKREMPPWYID